MTRNHLLEVPSRDRAHTFSQDYDAVDPPPSLALLRRHQHKPPALGHVKGHSSDLDTAGDQCVRAPVRQPSHRHCHSRVSAFPSPTHSPARSQSLWSQLTVLVIGSAKTRPAQSMFGVSGYASACGSFDLSGVVSGDRGTPRGAGPLREIHSRGQCGSCNAE